MNVIVVTPWFPNSSNPGEGLFIQRDVEMLAQDHRVVVVHLTNSADKNLPPTKQDNYQVITIPYSRTAPFSIIGAARKIGKLAQNADVVHSMAYYALLPVKIAGTKKPWIHTEHFSGVAAQPHNWLAWASLSLQKNLFKYPTTVVAVGASLAREINKYRATETLIIGNHVRPAKDENLSSPVSAPGKLKLIGVGNLIEHKGLRQAIEAVKILVEQGWDASLKWAGEGPLRSQAEELIQANGLADRVSLLGQIPAEQLPSLLAEANLFVLPTVSETFGVAVAEALTHGLPVVTSGEGEHLSFLPPQGSRVISQRTGPALAAAIVDLATDPSRLSHAEIAAHAKQLFSNEQRQQDYQQVYEMSTSISQNRIG